MNLRVPWNAGNFLTSCKPVSFSRRTMHRAVRKWAHNEGTEGCDSVLTCRTPSPILSAVSQRTIGSGWDLLKEYYCLFKPVFCRSNLLRPQQMALRGSLFSPRRSLFFWSQNHFEETVVPTIARLDMSIFFSFGVPELVYRNKYFKKKCNIRCKDPLNISGVFVRQLPVLKQPPCAINCVFVFFLSLP